MFRPFSGRPSTADWNQVLKPIIESHKKTPLDLVVIDPLSNFLSGNSENSILNVLKGLYPFRVLTTWGIGVLLAHHPKKGATASGQAAHGSGAITGFADIVMEMSCPGSAWMTTAAANCRPIRTSPKPAPPRDRD